MNGAKLVACNPIIIQARADIARLQTERSKAVLSRDLSRSESLTKQIADQRRDLLLTIKQLHQEGWE